MDDKLKFGDNYTNVLKNPDGTYSLRFSLYTNAVVDIISYTRNSGMSLDITLIDLSTNDLKNLLNILYSKLYKNVDIINAVREDGYERVHDDC